MKSKTSFFNATILRKDISRFLPVWLLYAIFLILNTIFFLGNRNPSDNANALQSLIAYSTIANFIYAAICAATLFGDLFVPRMCYALHALPIRREGWLLTHTLSGLLFCLIPDLAVSLLAIPMYGQYWFFPFLWLAGSALQFLFFFGMAVFCSLCAGNRLGMIAFYGIFNFLFPFVSGIIQLYYIPLLRGVVLNYDWIRLFSPVINLTSLSYLDTSLDGINNTHCTLNELIASDWLCLTITAAAGVLLIFGAILLYRRRNLERAGDFLSVRQFSPLFLLMISLLSGTILQMFFGIWDGTFSRASDFKFLFIGMLIGYFIGSMLLQRTARVFHLKTILGCGLTAALVGGTLFITALDPLDLETKVPAAENVASVEISLPRKNIFSPRITDPQEISKILAVHKALCSDTYESPDFDPDYGYRELSLTISYTLENGHQMKRSYVTGTETEAGKAAVKVLNQWQYVLGINHPEELLNTEYISFDIPDLEVWGAYVSPHRIPELAEAIIADCNAGAMSQFPTTHGSRTEIGTLQLWWPEDREAHRSYHCQHLRVFSDSTHTSALLRSLAQEVPYP